MPTTAAPDGMRAPQGGAMVQTWDTSLELRMNASAVGLLSVRVAAAAARVNAGGSLTDRDRQALKVVAENLHEEARVLRGDAAPDLRDETAYAVAGVTLTALGLRQEPTTDREPRDAEDPAARLDHIADDLDKIADGELVHGAAVDRVERLFVAISGLVSQGLGRTGERLEGVPEGAPGHAR